MENALFILESVCIAVCLILAAYIIEKAILKSSGEKERILTTRKIVVIGLLSALSAVLMLVEIPMPFAPPFYKLDFSEIPILIGAFALGPVTGVLTEFLKICMKLLFKGTTTAFVGDLANFLVGVSFVLPASLFYLAKKNRKTAVVSCVLGTIVMTVFGTILNAFYLIPTFADLYNMPLDAIIAMGTKLNGRITDLTTFVIWAVAPLNLIKGVSDSLITIIIYKRLSPIIKGVSPVRSEG